MWWLFFSCVYLVLEELSDRKGLNQHGKGILCWKKLRKPLGGGGDAKGFLCGVCFCRGGKVATGNKQIFD